MTPVRFVTTDFLIGADGENKSNVQGRWAGDAFAEALNDRTENDSINAANSVAERIRNPLLVTASHAARRNRARVTNPSSVLI